MPKSPPHAPRGKASYKQSSGKSSPGQSVVPSPSGHETVNPSQAGGNVPSSQLGPALSSVPGGAVLPAHFPQQPQGYESFTRPPRPEDIKNLPGNYVPYFGHPSPGMSPQFSERQTVKLEQEHVGQSSPQLQQRFTREYVRFRFRDTNMVTGH